MFKRKRALTAQEEYEKEVESYFAENFTYNDIDAPLKEYFSKKWELALVLVLLGIILSIMLLEPLFLLVFGFLAASAALTNVVDIRRCMKGKIGAYSGVIEEIERPNLLKRRLFIGSPSKILIKMENNYYIRMRIVDKWKLKLGNEVKVYADPHAAYAENDNTVYLSQYMLFYKSKN